MKGKIGGLFIPSSSSGAWDNGERQIGGFLDWDFESILTDSVEGKFRTYQFKKWKLISQAYWLFDAVPKPCVWDMPDTVIVRLFNDVGKGYWEGKGQVASKYQALFDTLIHEPIEIVGEGVLEGKETVV